jgi:hypothetical protein
MKAWRVLLALPFALLAGCLVSFTDPIPATTAAPVPLLGQWSRNDEWGEAQYLSIAPAEGNTYTATTWVGADDLDNAEEYRFSVIRHGDRWYASAPLPARFGGHYGIAGFELTGDNELVIYSLDPERFQAQLDGGVLKGRKIASEEGEALLVSSPLAQVFAFLDDPANTDAFTEVARYRHSAP